MKQEELNSRCSPVLCNVGTVLDRLSFQGEADTKAMTQVKVHDTTSAILKSAVRAELEIMALASRRAQAYIHLPVEMMTSRNPQDLFERAMGFYQTAFEQYSQSSNKVITIWGDAAQTMCGEAQKARDYIDFTQGASGGACTQRNGRAAAASPGGLRRVAAKTAKRAGSISVSRAFFFWCAAQALFEGSQRLAEARQRDRDADAGLFGLEDDEDGGFSRLQLVDQLIFPQ